MCRKKYSKAFSLVEMMVAMALVVIIFAAVVPQFRAIRNSWATTEASSTILQNAAVLADHINRNLATAKQIVSVSPSGVPTGFITFKDNLGATKKYMVSNGYVVFGDEGSEQQLAGPVSRFQISCYLINPAVTLTTDANTIRLVKVETDFANSSTGASKTFATSVYLQTNATTSCGLAGYWKLDETSGIIATDSSGSSNNGTLVNGPIWTTGQIGGALDFDGTDDYVNLGTGSSLNFGSSEPFTVAAWVKTTEFYGPIVSYRSSTDDGIVIDLTVGYDGAANDPGKAMILVRQDGGGGYANVASGTSVNDGQWHHVAAVRGSGSTVELFVDGNSQGTNSGSASGGAITADLRAIGSERRWVSTSYGTSDQRYLVGTIDDVRIYDRALTATEIAQLANTLRYQGFNENKTTFDSVSLAIGIPTGTSAGDLLIAAVATDGDTSGSITTAAAGWTQVAPPGASTSGAATLGAWYKIAGTSESAPIFNWAAGNPQQAYGWIMQFRGNDTNPATVINNSTPGQSSGTAPTSPAVNTTVNNCIILRLGAFDNNNITVGDPGLHYPPIEHTAITMNQSGGGSGTPTYQAAGAVVGGTGAQTAAWPIHQSGDVALLIVETANEAVTLSTPAGFVEVTNSPQGTGTAGGTSATRLTVYWKRATTSAEASPRVADSGNHQIAQIITFRGVIASGNPWDITAGNVASSASTSVSIPGATTTVANTLVVTIVCNGTDTTTAQTSGWTNANLTSLTERVDNANTSGNGGGFGVATGVKATAGAYGATTATLVTSSTQGRISIALKPSTVVTGTVSGGAGYVSQSAIGSSGTSNFSLNSPNEARMLTIAIAPNSDSSGDCSGGQIEP